MAYIIRGFCCKSYSYIFVVIHIIFRMWIHTYRAEPKGNNVSWQQRQDAEVTYFLTQVLTECELLKCTFTKWEKHQAQAAHTDKTLDDIEHTFLVSPARVAQKNNFHASNGIYNPGNYWDYHAHKRS